MALEQTQVGTISEHFSGLGDPRIDRSKLHKLIDIVTIAICAVICGADNWVAIETFGNAKKEWLKRFLLLPNGIPSHDTFGDVFARLHPQQFQSCFMGWVKAVSEVTKGQVLAVDGKTIRRSHDKRLGKAAIHMVNVWASTNRLVLGQTNVDEKSNEITAIPELLGVLEVSGCIVTIDAMGCQKEIARTIVDNEGDYVLALKENQGRLYEDVKDLFLGAHQMGFEDVPYKYHESVNKGHGRIETRRCWAISDSECLDYIRDGASWEKLRSVVMVSAERCIGDQTSIESRYYISSLEGNANQLLNATRGHWSVENSLHWVLRFPGG